jgi:hypothetical protein
MLAGCGLSPAKEPAFYRSQIATIPFPSPPKPPPHAVDFETSNRFWFPAFDLIP